MTKSLPQRIFRSLIRDLLIPWVISAFCIALFLLIVVKFGLIAWPICFGFFLFLCTLRSDNNKQKDTAMAELSTSTSSVLSAQTGYDWTHTKARLITGTKSALQMFFASPQAINHPARSLRAIGYTWEWGQPQPAFYVIANTAAGLAKGIADTAKYYPEDTLEEVRNRVRWDAGYFPFPAGLTGPSDELGDAWTQEANQMHAFVESLRAKDNSDEAQYAQYCENYERFSAELVDTCCAALVDLTLAGQFADCPDIDFWVGSTDEKGEVVRARDLRIREMLAARIKLDM
jgi:hypothetical protein